MGEDFCGSHSRSMVVHLGEIAAEFSAGYSL
jgi:hypothetical protein